MFTSKVSEMLLPLRDGSAITAARVTLFGAEASFDHQAHQSLNRNTHLIGQLPEERRTRINNLSLAC